MLTYEDRGRRLEAFCRLEHAAQRVQALVANFRSKLVESNDELHSIVNRRLDRFPWLRGALLAVQTLRAASLLKFTVRVAIPTALAIPAAGLAHSHEPLTTAIPESLVGWFLPFTRPAVFLLAIVATYPLLGIAEKALRRPLLRGSPRQWIDNILGPGIRPLRIASTWVLILQFASFLVAHSQPDLAHQSLVVALLLAGYGFMLFQFWRMAREGMGRRIKQRSA